MARCWRSSWRGTAFEQAWREPGPSRAMLRLIAWGLVASLACRWLAGRWPWQMAWFHQILGSKPRPGAHPGEQAPEVQRQLANARALLGVAPGASRAAIIAAHRRVMLAAHPDSGGSTLHAQAANAARDLLLEHFSNEVVPPRGSKNAD